MSSGLRAPETQGGDHAPLSLATCQSLPSFQRPFQTLKP